MLGVIYREVHAVGPLSIVCALGFKQMRFPFCVTCAKAALGITLVVS